VFHLLGDPLGVEAQLPFQRPRWRFLPGDRDQAVFLSTPQAWLAELAGRAIQLPEDLRQCHGL
jgi:hypothetical protein